MTTHIGLIDAVDRIEPGLVERTIRRGHEALVDAGNPNPKIGVCGINPHAGENGLFGYGEEETKIDPGVEAARADGIDVHGALPADTLFFLAGRGDYDLVVAMYHDQGHGPVKVLGLEAGVNVTIGLPVIRTSVDHGTAFDIAGTGIADHRSMIEALRLGAEMAPRPVGRLRCPAWRSTPHRRVGARSSASPPPAGSPASRSSPTSSGSPPRRSGATSPS